MRYAFIHTYKPILDDEPYRSFDAMQQYRQWCERNLPDWLGYGVVSGLVEKATKGSIPTS